MAVVLSCSEITKTHGSRRLFTNLSLGVDDGSRLGLIGPNGAGKTTLLEILAGVQQADSGERSLRRLARLGYAPQDSVFDADRTAAAIVDGALAPLEPDEHQRAVKVSVALGKVGFTREDVRAGELSGGWRKRLAIASELVKEPDVLLLDEPTNHLDLDGIEWLEKLLVGERSACIFVSHDRYFLDNVATEIAEINPAFPEGIFRTTGDYKTFLERREEFLEAQSKQRQSLANKVRTEVEWLRRGPKARTSKSRARIDVAHEMISELDERTARARTGTAQIDFGGTQRRTKRLVVAEGLSKSLGGQTLFRELTFTLAPGMRLGIVGPNGSGKTTLMRILLGSLAPDQGTLTRADALQTVTLDQHRAALDPEQSLRRTLAPEGDSLIVRGKPVHVAGWAKRFLFREEQLQLPISSLSGGERARAAIARLMVADADLLALDEPTNDLDIPTLEALEETLLEFPGALVLVTHDRHLLDKVCNVVVGLDGDGEAGLYADYYQWEDARDARRKDRLEQTRAAKPAAPQAATKRSKKLSYHEQREWDSIEAKILEAESELAEATAAMNDPANASDHTKAAACHERAEKAQAAVDGLYERWAELEAKQASSED